MIATNEVTRSREIILVTEHVNMERNNLKFIQWCPKDRQCYEAEVNRNDRILRLHINIVFGVCLFVLFSQQATF